MRSTLSALALATATMISGPTLAHQGHESCAGGAPGAVEELGLPIGPGPGFGTGFVEPLARSGTAAAAIAAFHEAFCEPHDSGEDEPAASPKK